MERTSKIQISTFETKNKTHRYTYSRHISINTIQESDVQNTNMQGFYTEKVITSKKNNYQWHHKNRQPKKTLEGREFHSEMVRGKNENLKRLVRAKIGVNEY